MSRKKSKVYEYRGRKFRYNYEKSVIEHIDQLTPSEAGINERYRKKYGKPIFETDKSGYYIFSEIEMSAEDWKNKAARDKRLEKWCLALDKAEEELELNHEGSDKK